MILQPNDFILIILLLLSLYFDLTKKKIPNFLTLPAIIWGLLSNTVTGGLEGFIFSSYGLLLGIALFIIPFILGGMGGGDVKLLGAVGAMKGAQFVFHATLFTALCGGVLAIIYLIINGQFLKTLKRVLGMAAVPFFTALYFRFRNPYFNQLSLYFSQDIKIKQTEKKIYLPYGVAIVSGALIVLFNFGEQLIPLAGIILK